ncbi:MAG: hypothetical protein M1831_005402 [Alyxoria varia]|nr:MAG: hypothetical protein M1831_005402 [Alyxoria varia]
MSPPPVSSGKAYMAMATVALYSCALSLLTHYSGVMPLVNGHQYSTISAVIVIAIIQLSVSLTMALFEVSVKNPHLPVTELYSVLSKSVLSTDGFRVIFPALLYSLQSVLQIAALKNLGPATFQCIYQMRICYWFTTSQAVSRTTLSTRHWFAFILMALGAFILIGGLLTSHWWPRTLEDPSGLGTEVASQLSNQNHSSTFQEIQQGSAIRYPELDMNDGANMALLASILSGVADTYVEKMLKDSPGAEFGLLAGRRGGDIWAKNAQMSFFSVVIAVLFRTCSHNLASYRENGGDQRTSFFAGFNGVVWSVVGLQAFGGAAVAFVTPYLSSMLEGFACINSILLTFALSICLFQSTGTHYFALGAIIIVGARWLFASGGNVLEVEGSDLERATVEYEKFEDDPKSTPRPGTPIGVWHHRRSPSARRS